VILGDAAPELRVYVGNTSSIFRIILSAHCAAAATMDSVLGLGLESRVCPDLLALPESIGWRISLCP